MTRGKALIGLVCATILLGALALGVMGAGGVSARQLGIGIQSTETPKPEPNPEKYCVLYDQTLASKLGVSVARLDADRVSALRTVIQKAYSDGAITQTQEQNLLDKANQLAKNPCAAVGHMIATHGDVGHVMAGAHQTILAATAASLNLPPATLESELSSGETIPMIAASQHVSIDTVNTAYLGAVQNVLQTAVTNGSITQDQAGSAYAAFQRAVHNGVYPLLRTHK